LLVTGALFAIVIAEGAYIIKTRRQMDTLTTQVQQLAAEAVAEGGDATAAREPSRGNGWVGERPTATSGAPGRLPPPRFNTAPAPSGSPPAGSPAGGQTPLPAVLDTPEARGQLRQFVAAELQRERDDWRQQQQQARDEEAQRRLEATIKTLGLNADEGKKLTDIVTKSQDQRRQLRDKVQSGQLARADVAREFTTLREQTDKELKAALGDDKAQKFQEMQRQNRGPGGGPGGPGGPRGWGPPPM
jgi:hypothetical protein